MSLKLSEERKGQIALIILKREVANKQLNLNRNDYKRKIGNAATELKDAGVSKEELETMYEEIVREAFERMFVK